MPVSLITENDFRPQRFEEATAALRRKVPVTDEEFARLTTANKGQALKIANVNNARLVQQIRDFLARKLGEGKTFAEVKDELRAMFDGAGIPQPALSRLRFSYLENVRRSYAEARRAVLEEEAVQHNFPYWKYLTVGNGTPGFRNVRPEHAALHGKVFAADDPVWNRFYPPWDFGCRCSVIPLTAGMVRRGQMTVWTYRGGRVVAANGPRRGRGFKLEPNDKYDRSAKEFDLSSLDADLRKVVEERSK